ncbi:MAG: diaminopimelate epimerase [Acidimicrobiales bacterium]
MATRRMSKHHGLGNDFLVMVNSQVQPWLGPEVARWLCDRHWGIGADGFIQVNPGPNLGGTGWAPADSLSGAARADVVMDLRNADGSPAEMSGNGIRCMAQAVWDQGLVTGPDMAVATAAGLRQVTVTTTVRTGLVDVSVSMGPVQLGLDYDVGGFNQSWRGRLADMGNPHLVIVVARATDIEVSTWGPAVEAAFDGGMNVEFISPGSEPDEVDLVVWERGAGATRACGTGSAAAAAVAQDWGLVGHEVVVHNPGGDLRVSLGGTDVVLTGPAQRICGVEVDLETAPA